MDPSKLIFKQRLIEIKAVMSKLKNRRASGTDISDAEISKYDGEHLCSMLTGVIQRIWHSEVVA